MYVNLCSSGSRPGSSAASPMIPPYPGSNARARDRVQALQAYYQQHQPNNSTMRTPHASGTRRSSSHRGVAQLAPVASPPDQSGAFFLIPSGSSGRSFQEQENHQSRFHAWERDHLPPLSSNHVVEREAGWVAYHQAATGSEPGLRFNGVRLRHGSERLPSQNR